MSKKKPTIQPEEIESTAEVPVEAPVVEVAPEPPKPVQLTQPAEKPAAPTRASAPAVKVPKKRIRIRKKATKKLSAAILIKDPTLTRFI